MKRRSLLAIALPAGLNASPIQAHEKVVAGIVFRQDPFLHFGMETAGASVAPSQTDTESKPDKEPILTDSLPEQGGARVSGFLGDRIGDRASGQDSWLAESAVSVVR